MPATASKAAKPSSTASGRKRTKSRLLAVDEYDSEDDYTPTSKKRTAPGPPRKSDRIATPPPPPAQSRAIPAEIFYAHGPRPSYRWQNVLMALRTPPPASPPPSPNLPRHASPGAIVEATPLREIKPDVKRPSQPVLAVVIPARGPPRLPKTSARKARAPAVPRRPRARSVQVAAKAPKPSSRRNARARAVVEADRKREATRQVEKGSAPLPRDLSRLRRANASLDAVADALSNVIANERRRLSMKEAEKRARRDKKAELAAKAEKRKQRIDEQRRTLLDLQAANAVVVDLVSESGESEGDESESEPVDAESERSEWESEEDLEEDSEAGWEFGSEEDSDSEEDSEAGSEVGSEEDSEADSEADSGSETNHSESEYEESD